ncbi:MAG: cytidine deaminase [Oscillospiraceae bacterium]|jgi:cytidine deaminase|nr:cytidine deaminase [Oscillospiraceae bacterium]
MQKYKDLINKAIAAREGSYSPYSGFMVGAALLTSGGKTYCGCNIENAAFTPANCAERTAFFTAVAAGERDFSAIAVAGWPKGGAPGFAFPCGVCRQVMAEFCRPDFVIIIAAGEDEYKISSLRELLPESFGPADLA